MSFEKELKLLLSKDGHSFLLNSFHEIINPLTQINYYFDTKEFYLNQLGVTLRIREEGNDNLILCLKSKLNDSSNSITTSREIEKKISRNDFNKYKNQPEYIINNFYNDLPNSSLEKLLSENIRCMGSIRNERRKISLTNNYIGDLDYTIYPNGQTFYELEIEDMESEDDVDIILDYLDFYNIAYTINNKSKYKRFVECIQTD